MTTFTRTNDDGSTVTIGIEQPAPVVTGYTYTPPPAQPAPADPPPTTAPFLVGAGCKEYNVLTGTGDAGQMIGLVFHSPGQKLVPNEIAVATRTGCLPLSLFKDDPTETIVNPWLDAVQAAGIGAWLCLDQEDNANHYRTPTVYKSLWSRLAGIVAAHPAAGQVTLVEKFSDFAGVARWEDYWTGLADGLLFDRYHQTAYPPPDVFYAVELAARDELAGFGDSPRGVPYFWGIGETGLTWQQASDPTGTGQADALSAYAGFIEVEGGRCIILWNGKGTDSRNFTCAAPARYAWRGIQLAASARV